MRAEGCFGRRSADVRVGQAINIFCAVTAVRSVINIVDISVGFVGFRAGGRGGSFAWGIPTNGGFYTLSLLRTRSDRNICIWQDVLVIPMDNQNTSGIVGSVKKDFYVETYMVFWLFRSLGNCWLLRTCIGFSSCIGGGST